MSRSCTCGIAPYKHLKGYYCYKWLYYIPYSMSCLIKKIKWKIFIIYRILIGRHHTMHHIIIEGEKRRNRLLEMLGEYESRQYSNFVNSNCPSCEQDLNPFCRYGEEASHKKNCKLVSELIQYAKNKTPIQLFERKSNGRL